MTREQFKKDFIDDVKIRISNREECYTFQRIAFEFGAKVHSQMLDEEQEPILFNIADEYPQYKNESFAKDMDNLVIYPNGRIQKSGFYNLEKGKEINFEDFIRAYAKL